MRRWTGSALVQIMACRLVGAKPLSEPLLENFQLDSWDPISTEFESEFYHFHSRKCIWNCRLPKWRSFCPGGGGVNARARMRYYMWLFYVDIITYPCPIPVDGLVIHVSVTGAPCAAWWLAIIYRNLNDLFHVALKKTRLMKMKIAM